MTQSRRQPPAATQGLRPADLQAALSTMTTPAGSTTAPSPGSTAPGANACPAARTRLAACINAAFERLTTICTAWRQAARDQSADGNINAWAKAWKLELLDSLLAAGVTSAAEIDEGVNRFKAEGKDFLPNPGHLAALCFDPTRHGLPSFEQAWQQAVHWPQTPVAQRHPAVLYARSQIGNLHNWSKADEASAQRQFSRAWQKTLAHVVSGGELPVIAQPLTHQEAPVGTRAERLLSLQQLRDATGLE